MKYKYVYLAIIIMTILHMYYVHAYTYPSKRMVSVMNVTQPNSTLKEVTYYNPYKHYSYHKQTLSLFYMKRRGKGQRPHIR
jgi:hypothetical protein